MAETKKNLPRRNFLKRGLAVTGAAALGAFSLRAYQNQVGRRYDPVRTAEYLAQVQPAASPETLPNIIIVMADDLGYGDLSVYGDGPIQTPSLKQMASEGVLLTQFYASAPTCTPSRASLLTGRYAIRSHMTLPVYPSNHPMEYVLKLVNRYRYDVTGIPEDEALLSEILQKRGYRTGLVGKWHLGDQKKHLPNDNGFDFFYGVLYPNDDRPLAVYRNEQVEIPDIVPQDELTQLYTREALHFIEDNRNTPFFLYLSHSAVHEPLFAGKSFQGRSQAGLYGDSVEELDWSMGELLRTLKELGLERNTLVVFTSDNGPWWQGDAGGLRGRKNNVLEGGFRVPMIARWPGTLPSGQVSNAVSIIFDLLPTCLALAGVPPPSDRVIDGMNLLPVLQGQQATLHDTFFYYDGPILVAVRYRQWKYHRQHMSDNGGFPLFYHGPFLFDLEKDPNESYNLIDTYPQVTRELAELLDQWEAQMNANPRGWL